MFWLYKYILICGILQELVMTSHEVPETSKIRLFKRHHRVKIPKKYVFNHNLPFTMHSYKAKLKEIMKKLKNNNLLPLFKPMFNGRHGLSRPTDQSIFFNQQKLIENLGGQKLSNKYFKKIQRLLQKPVKHHGIVRTHAYRQNCTSDGLFPDLYSCRSYHYCLGGKDYLYWCKDNLVYSHRHKACMKRNKSTKCFKFRCKNGSKKVPYEGDANIYALCQRKRPMLISKCPDGFIFHKRYQSCLPNCNAVFSDSKGCKKLYKCLAEYQNSPKRYQKDQNVVKLPQLSPLDLYNLCLKVIFQIEPINGSIISFESTEPNLISGKSNTTTTKHETSSSIFNVTLTLLDLSSASQTEKNEHQTTNTSKKNKQNLMIIYIQSGNNVRPQNINNSQNPQCSGCNIISAFVSGSGASSMQNPTFNKLPISNPETMNTQTHISSTVPTNDGNVREWKTYIKTLLKGMHTLLWLKETKRINGHEKETELKYSFNETLKSTPDTNLNNQELNSRLATNLINEITTAYISRPSTLGPKELSLPLRRQTDITVSPLTTTTEPYSNIIDSSENFNIPEFNKSENLMSDVISILPNTDSETNFLTEALSTEFDHGPEYDKSTESPRGVNTFTYDGPEEEDATPTSYFITRNSNMTENNDVNTNENGIPLHTKEDFDDLRSEIEKTTSRSNFVDIPEEEIDTEIIPQEETENTTNMDFYPESTKNDIEV